MTEVDVWQARDRWEVVTLPDDDAAVTFAVAHWVEMAHEAIEERGLFSVALAGGSTPKAMYHKLADPDIAALIDWSRVLLFWSDERNVPPDHQDSNYRMAMEAGFNRLPLKEDHIFRMHAETDLEVNAAAYEHVIIDKTGGILDLTMLGMGADGHTASLFPGTEALEIEDRLVVPNYIPQQDAWRMTFTFPLINASRCVALYVLGEAKHERLDAVMEPTNEYPVQRIDRALWITDVDIGH